MAAYARICRLIGPSGAGQLAKMMNQICIAGLMQGLSEALVATAVGLFVAIPCVVSYNYFSGQVKDFLSRVEAFGRILRAVEANSGDRETLVLLTTDHGIAFPRAKSTLYDSGVKVSFIVRPPASWAVAPARRAALTSHLDIVPTLLDAAGAAAPAGLPGRSIRPLLTSEPAEDSRVLYLEKTYHDGFDPMRAVRDSDSKLIRNYAQGPARQPLDIEQSTTHRGMPQEPLPDRPREELYDLVSDPDELRNVIGQPGYAPLQRRLAELLDSHLIETDDPDQMGAALSRLLPGTVCGVARVVLPGGEISAQGRHVRRGQGRAVRRQCPALPADVGRYREGQ